MTWWLGWFLILNELFDGIVRFVVRTKDIDVVAGLLKEPEMQFFFYDKVVLLMFWHA